MLGGGLGLLVAKLLNLIIPIPSELLAWLTRVSKAENVDCAVIWWVKRGCWANLQQFLCLLGYLVNKGQESCKVMDCGSNLKGQKGQLWQSLTIHIPCIMESLAAFESHFLFKLLKVNRVCPMIMATRTLSSTRVRNQPIFRIYLAYVLCGYYF